MGLLSDADVIALIKSGWPTCGSILLRTQTIVMSAGESGTPGSRELGSPSGGITQILFEPARERFPGARPCLTESGPLRGTYHEIVGAG